MQGGRGGPEQLPPEDGQTFRRGQRDLVPGCGSQRGDGMGASCLSEVTSWRLDGAEGAVRGWGSGMGERGRGRGSGLGGPCEVGGMEGR